MRYCGSLKSLSDTITFSLIPTSGQMKIVVISQVVYPRQSPRSFRATELAKYFAKQGHEVVLYGSLGDYDYTTFSSSTGVQVKSLGRLRFSTLNSSSSVRNSFFDKAFKTLFGRLFEYPDIELAFKVKRVLQKERGVDLLVTVAIPYPIHWGAAWAKKTMGGDFAGTWISDCGDAYINNPVGPKKPFYFKYVEDFWGRQTDFVTYPINAPDDFLPSAQEKLHVIPQGFDFSTVRIVDSFTESETIQFAYAGATYPGYRDPTKLLEYLSSRSDVSFRFIVYTKARTHFLKYQDALGDKLVLKDYIPREDLIYELSKMDFLINIKNDSAVQSPSKLIDYYLTKRPIIDISTAFNEKQILDEFLCRNYIHQHEKRDISCFDINRVGQQFLDLQKSKSDQNL